MSQPPPVPNDTPTRLVSTEGENSEPPALVLIVDDVDHGREICAEFLAFRGFRVATAADGLEALEKAFELRPDAILMDLSLPRLDGWEATRRLKGDDRTREIPVIALTAHALASAHERALAAGCVSILTKPCLPRDLESEIRRQLKGGHEYSVPPESIPRPPTKAESQPNAETQPNAQRKPSSWFSWWR